MCSSGNIGAVTMRAGRPAPTPALLMDWRDQNSENIPSSGQTVVSSQLDFKGNYAGCRAPVFSRFWTNISCRPSPVFPDRQEAPAPQLRAGGSPGLRCYSNYRNCSANEWLPIVLRRTDRNYFTQTALWCGAAAITGVTRILDLPAPG